MEKKKRIVGISLGVAAVIVIPLLLFGLNSNTTPMLNGGTPEVIKEDITLVEETYTRACTNYEDEDTCVPDSMFRDLPPVPEKFGEIKALFWADKLDDWCNLDIGYILQPEFYWKWMHGGIQMYLDGIKPGRTAGIWGYTFYPAELTVLNIKPGETINICNFPRTAWFVEKYQAFRIVPVFPKGEIYGIGGIIFSGGLTNITQIEDISGYFEITTNPEFMILEPTYSHFHKNWVQKLNIQIKVAPNTPPGKYMVGLNQAPPTKEQMQDLFWELGTAVVTTGNVGNDRPAALLIAIEVV